MTWTTISRYTNSLYSLRKDNSAPAICGVSRISLSANDGGTDNLVVQLPRPQLHNLEGTVLARGNGEWRPANLYFWPSSDSRGWKPGTRIWFAAEASQLHRPTAYRGVQGPTCDETRMRCIWVQTIGAGVPTHGSNSVRAGKSRNILNSLRCVLPWAEVRLFRQVRSTRLRNCCERDSIEEVSGDCAATAPGILPTCCNGHPIISLIRVYSLILATGGRGLPQCGIFQIAW